MSEPWTVWGIECSLFTGKLEGILRAKGVEYTPPRTDIANQRRLSALTGIMQMPTVEAADGTIYSDTTLIHRWLEDNHSGPSLSPAAPHARFISRLIEDWADEYMWRPAMYFRWIKPACRQVSAGRIVDQMMPKVALPRWLKIRMIRFRQYGIYVWGDGVRTKAQRAATDQLYYDLLDVLEQILATRPFIMGDRPTEADFGLFGPFFRHFFYDPLPGPIMQARAPHVALWCTRMWANRPEKFADKPLIADVPDDLGPLFAIINRDYFPYMAANAQAVAAGNKKTRHHTANTDWSEYTKPFRLWCYSEIKSEFAGLNDADQTKVGDLLGQGAIDHLCADLPCPPPVAPPAIPLTPDQNVSRQDSWMR
ncbi:MAG: glutathione S-transferase family protein [Alphaproteobacteria bacterium]